MRKDGKLKGKKGSHGRNAKGIGKSLWWETSWPRKGHGKSPGKECKTEELCPKKTETCSDANPCTKNTFSAVGCGRMWKMKKRKEGGVEQGRQR